MSVPAETEHEELPHTGKNTGLHSGIKDLCITSDGEKHENPEIIKLHEKICLCGNGHVLFAVQNINREVNDAKNILAERLRQIA